LRPARSAGCMRGSPTSRNLLSFSKIWVLSRPPECWSCSGCCGWEVSPFLLWCRSGMLRGRLLSRVSGSGKGLGFLVGWLLEIQPASSWIYSLYGSPGLPLTPLRPFYEAVLVWLSRTLCRQGDRRRRLPISWLPHLGASVTQDQADFGKTSYPFQLAQHQPNNLREMNLPSA
jgi:hypothetical protein